TAIVPIVEHHVERLGLGLAINKHADLLTRARRQERASYIPDIDPRDGVDGGSRFAWSAFAEGGEGHVENSSTVVEDARRWGDFYIGFAYAPSGMGLRRGIGGVLDFPQTVLLPYLFNLLLLRPL